MAMPSLILMGCFIGCSALSNSHGVSITSSGSASSMIVSDAATLRIARVSSHEGRRQAREVHKVSPGSSIDPSQWPKAVNQLVSIPSSVVGVNETIWASGDQSTCGEDCVAHCVAGQPREFSLVPGLRKALKHRVFERFSTSYVVFAVFVTSPYHRDAGNAAKDGQKGFARTEVGDFTDTVKLAADMADIGVHRALLIHETCQEPSCMENPSLQCDARDLGLQDLFDTSDDKVHNICDVQIKRFQTCMNLVRSYEKERSVTFKWVTRSRPDVYWVKPIGPASELDQAAYFHAWSVAYGGSDWFYALPRAYADVLARFPDEASCSQLHHPEIQQNCKILGCECWVASWMFRQGVPFKQFVGVNSNACIPTKFCGQPCAYDWDVSPATIENAASFLQPDTSYQIITRTNDVF